MFLDVKTEQRRDALYHKKIQSLYIMFQCSTHSIPYQIMSRLGIGSTPLFLYLYALSILSYLIADINALYIYPCSSVIHPPPFHTSHTTHTHTHSFSISNFCEFHKKVPPLKTISRIKTKNKSTFSSHHVLFCSISKSLSLSRLI